MSSEVTRAIEAYVSAELQCKSIRKKFVDKKGDLKERINTCKQYLLEQMCSRNISCMEIKSTEDASLNYIRVKHVPVGTKAYNSEDLMNWLRCVSYEEGDQSILDVIQSKSSTTETKPSIEISPSKERGVEIHPLPNDLKDVSHELISSKAELKEITIQEKADLFAYEHTKEQHSDRIIDYLKNKDPVNRVQRLTIPDGNKTWTYFIRCVETIKSKPIKHKQIMQISTPIVSSLKISDILDRTKMKTVEDMVETSFQEFVKTSISKTYSLQLQKGPLKK